MVFLELSVLLVSTYSSFFSSTCFCGCFFALKAANLSLMAYWIDWKRSCFICLCSCAAGPSDVMRSWLSWRMSRTFLDGSHQLSVHVCTCSLVRLCTDHLPFLEAFGDFLNYLFMPTAGATSLIEFYSFAEIGGASAVILDEGAWRLRR